MPLVVAQVAAASPARREPWRIPQPPEVPVKKLELNLETVRRLDHDPQDSHERNDRGMAMTKFCTNTCNHTTCEVC